VRTDSGFSVQAEWTKYAEVEVATGYMDLSTIKKTSNGYRVWQITDIKEINNGGEASMKSLTEYDCQDEKLRKLQITGYSGHMGNGKITRREDIPSRWNYIAPESVGASGFELVCGKKR
jgi:hypothetical protein